MFAKNICVKSIDHCFNLIFSKLLQSFILQILIITTYFIILDDIRVIDHTNNSHTQSHALGIKDGIANQCHDSQPYPGG